MLETRSIYAPRERLNIRNPAGESLGQRCIKSASFAFPNLREIRELKLTAGVARVANATYSERLSQSSRYMPPSRQCQAVSSLSLPDFFFFFPLLDELACSAGKASDSTRRSSELSAVLLGLNGKLVMFRDVWVSGVRIGARHKGHSTAACQLEQSSWKLVKYHLMIQSAQNVWPQ